MPIAERVTDYSVALLRNDVVDYQQVVKLTTGTELPGEGPADDEALVQLMATIRQHLGDSESPVPPE